MSVLFMRFPGGKSKAVTLSYDDGVEQDKRLIEIMKKNGLKGTFNLNGGSFAKEGIVYPKGTIHRRMTQAECIELYTESGMEVATHGFTHPYLEKLSNGRCTYEIMEDRRRLEDVFHRRLRGHAYPYGAYTDQVVRCLEHCEIAYARTVESTRDFDIPYDWLRLKPTCHHKDPLLDELTDRFVCDKTFHEPWLFYLWGHSYEFDQDDNWDVIERFAQKTGDCEEIWYATNIEIFDYVQAYKRLEYSVDGKRVHNPTAVTLYFAINKVEDYKVEPGETIEVD